MNQCYKDIYLRKLMESKTVIAIITLLTLLLMEQLTYGLFYSDLSFITASFFPDMDKKKLGYYAGYIMSAFYLGQLPGCLFWGWIADKYGRKKPLSIVVLLDSIFIFAFAFIRNYYIAVVLRLLWGFCDGHYALIKTLISDYSNEKTIARTSSFMFLSVAIGNAISPLLGGYLSNPENLSPWLVQHFPILLKRQFCFPFIICGSGLILYFIGVWWFVDDVCVTYESLLSDEVHHQGSSYWYLLQNRSILITVILYGIEALCQVSYDSLISLWLSSDRSDGGLNMTAVDIGWLLCFVCPMQAGNLIVFPVMTEALSVTTTYSLISSLQTLLLLWTPFVTEFLSYQLIIVLLYVSASLFHLFRTILFNSGVVLIAQTCPPSCRAKSYGLSQMLGGTGRFIGPPLLSSLFAWSIGDHHPYPLNYASSYCVLSLLSLISVFLSFMLTRSVKKCID